jgi:hypothetical protein
VLRGNRRGPLPLRWVYLHLLRELAKHEYVGRAATSTL